MSAANNSIRPHNRRYGGVRSLRDRCDGTIAARSLSGNGARRKLTSHCNIAVVRTNEHQFHAANLLLLRLSCQQAIPHGSLQAITKRRHDLSSRLRPRELFGTCVGLLFIPPRWFLTLGQCAVGIPDGVYRCAKLAPESCDQDASYSFAAHASQSRLGFTKGTHATQTSKPSLSRTRTGPVSWG